MKSDFVFSLAFGDFDSFASSFNCLNCKEGSENLREGGIASEGLMKNYNNENRNSRTYKHTSKPTLLTQHNK